MKKLKSKRTFSWMNPKLEVKKTEKTGMGVFAKKDIKKGELVAAFGGYAMTLDEFFKLPQNVMHYSSQISEEMVFGIRNMNEIDDSYYFNHSCNPNVGYGGQLFLRAMRRISKGEEVTYDYGMELYPSKTPNPKDVERFDVMKCDCGAKNCRKIITEYDWKIPELQKRYDGYFSWFIQEKINKLKKIKNGI